MTTSSQRPKTAKPHSVRLRVSTEELEWLQEEAERTDRSVSALLRRALREYIDARRQAS